MKKICKICKNKFETDKVKIAIFMQENAYNNRIIEKPNYYCSECIKKYTVERPIDFNNFDRKSLRKNESWFEVYKTEENAFNAFLTYVKSRNFIILDKK